MRPRGSWLVFALAVPASLIAAPAAVQGDETPSLQVGQSQVSGKLSKDVIRRVIRQRTVRFRACYEAGLQKNPKLAGRVDVSFTIAVNGNVVGVQTKSETIDDAEVLRCIRKEFAALVFPKPDAGEVTVSYPLVFAPAS